MEHRYESHKQMYFVVFSSTKGPETKKFVNYLVWFRPIKDLPFGA